MQSTDVDHSAVVEIQNLTTVLGRQTIHQGLNLSIQRGEIIAIIGPSGQGKTTLLRVILMLLRPRSGSVKVEGIDVTQCTEAEAEWVRQQWGVMFQSGALFSSLTVLENVMFPILENKSEISEQLMREIALFKIALVGLNKGDAEKYPAQLSGGMKKRAALARALALDPALIFLDEPTTGLDPKSADDFDTLMLRLHKNLDVTLIIVTHDLDTLWRVPDRIVFIGAGKVLAACKMEELISVQHPLIQDYLSGPRGHQRRVVEAE